MLNLTGRRLRVLIVLTILLGTVPWIENNILSNDVETTAETVAGQGRWPWLRQNLIGAEHSNELCVIAGASSSDRELVRIMAQSLFSATGSEFAPLHLFLYDNNADREDNTGFLIASTTAVRERTTVLSRSELEFEKGSTIVQDVAAAIAIAAKRKQCAFVMVTSGRTFYSKHFANVRLHDTQQVHAFSHFGAASYHAEYSRPQQDCLNRTILCSAGTAVPIALIASGRIDIDTSHSTSCGRTPQTFTWIIPQGSNIEISDFQFEDIPPTSYSGWILGRRPIIMDNPKPHPVLKTMPLAKLPNVCTLVRTYSADAKTLDTLIRTVLMNSQKSRMKVFVVNPQAVTNSEGRSKEETWLRTAVSEFPAEKVRALTYKDLRSSIEKFESIDPFGYVVTDAALQHESMSNCQYYIVTNGDNFYRPEFFSNLYQLIGEASPPEFVLTDFVNRYLLDVLRVSPNPGYIDLGAAVFSRNLYLKVKFVNMQKTIEDWNLSDGKFFEAVNRLVPEAKRKILRFPYFFHQ